MTSAVFDFRSIKRKLDRQEQKAEYEAKNPEPTLGQGMYGWPYGVAVPMADEFKMTDESLLDWIKANKI